LAFNKEWSLKDIIRKPYFVPETKKINDLLSELQQKRIQIAIVIDEFGGTAGMVTLEDIVEEIVGEIQDEYDEEKPTVERISETEFVINAYATVYLMICLKTSTLILLADWFPTHLAKFRTLETVRNAMAIYSLS
jgi:CBS domain containing-hemolysin-like protein